MTGQHPPGEQSCLLCVRETDVLVFTLTLRTRPSPDSGTLRALFQVAKNSEVGFHQVPTHDIANGKIFLLVFVHICLSCRVGKYSLVSSAARIHLLGTVLDAICGKNTCLLLQTDLG
ncbi:hypothetical protein OS493_011062 [Desmophyllum pertusum]|uniref:Uncharacterized protein n=1 Tax=Desmophyllum pertusum TaxID=174260 RepID=A0A9X0CRY9_9CNID|nr:hypothetical protein OS493_011062 [Desmophyllum pertusum]